MPVITFANTKGGAGKTTAVLLLSTELARQGNRVTILDADPQRWISRWHETGDATANITVVPYVTLATIQTVIAQHRPRTDYFILDLPGASSPLLATAIGMSDHVLIPIQGCAMDAKGGAQVLELLKYLEDKANIRIPHSVVLSRVNSMVTTRALQAVKSLLAARSVRVLDTPIIERAAYRDLFDYGCSLYEMDATRVSNLDRAKENAEAFANEVLGYVPNRAATRPSLSQRDVLRSAA
ncbi:ParA family protein [Rhizobium sp. KVB221]|uniref:ParA family protein n=1 Tax=Rhizobium setariae TaxID=2801340 RepID=A0A936YWQ1_9HYPH|nr:ParA family protein [Rhizobium setariae]MBL0375327.1 ParA family protein [Rhizobium setariae]